MGQLTIRDVTRCGTVVRWHTVRTLRDQTLAEHLFMVTMYTKEIMRRVQNPKAKSTVWSAELLTLATEWALMHDITEVLAGDIITPTKNRIRSSNPNVFNDLDREISEDCFETKQMVTGTPIEYVVKLADLIDSIVFLNDEGLGEHSKSVKARLSNTFIGVKRDAARLFPSFLWDESAVILAEALTGPGRQIDYEYIK